MKYLLSSLALCTTLLLPQIANADIAPEPGTHEYSTHAVFDNLADYPDYDVYATNNWRFGPTPILAGDAVAPESEQLESNGHPSSSVPPFFAVKKSNQALITHQEDPNGEQGDMWGSLTENQQYKIDATVTGEGADLGENNLPDSNAAVYVVWVYHIDNLTDTSFTAHFVNEARYDSDGKLAYGALTDSVSTSTATTVPTSNSEPSTTAVPSETPEASQTPIWIAISCLGVALLAVAIKAWRK